MGKFLIILITNFTILSLFLVNIPKVLIPIIILFGIFYFTFFYFLTFQESLSLQGYNNLRIIYPISRTGISILPKLVYFS